MSQNKTVVNKLYYSISEVSTMLGIPASTLRYWEKELPTVSPRKSQGGTRKYSATDIEELRLVFRLVKEEGHTIDGVKRLLRRRRSTEQSKQEVISRLEAVRSELLGMIDELDRVSAED
ncbi:MAG: MerR family transcriptional regulator [Bacteroidaceae bacterium]|nr:MerR family transcriptional regulator [Bacteroidales bacterium]MBP3670449.1 MerR family transcriptional regulator [Bacteroidaceae bacterium]MBQ2978546.1 MerR family transcriptional regulator [Bacteroidaceae bacterium]